MVLYGYTIGEDRDSNPSNGNQLDVYRFLIPTAPGGTITPTQVGTVNIAGTVTNPDLEGLGTNPATNRVSAVNEARATPLPNAPGPVIVVNNVDQPFAPAQVSPTPTPSNLVRFGFESGADFSGQQNALYNISGNRTANLGGEQVGSSLYQITTANPGTISLVDTFGLATTAAQTQGTQPTNPGKYADGLAIDNLNPGRTRALASDFSTGDGDGAQLHKVDLLTGELSAPITLRTPSGQALNVNADSGLAFTNFGSQNSQRLFALLETGAVYEITNYEDDLAASGLGLGSGSFATATLLGNVNLPNALVEPPANRTNYEGFTIVNE
uniref:Water stress protein 2 n=1 Tax=Nostoc flagelliforme str. Sunitezuoqi TaxID=676037 RepID=V5RE44_9NOSO|nr:water stress protein 2 [Nostoc flagelliforme str. Sunitezuoqi]